MGVTRTSGFGALSWLWWPVLFAGWALAAAVMAVEWACKAPPGPGKAPGGPGSHRRKHPPRDTLLERAENRPGARSACHANSPDRGATAPYVVPPALLALLALAACAGPGSSGDPALVAPARPTVPVDNPFFCPHPPTSLDTPTCAHP